MPADGIPSCPFASNGDIGTSRLEELLLRLRSYASPNIRARIKCHIRRKAETESHRNHFVPLVGSRSGVTLENPHSKVPASQEAAEPSYPGGEPANGVEGGAAQNDEKRQR